MSVDIEPEEKQTVAETLSQDCLEVETEGWAGKIKLTVASEESQKHDFFGLMKHHGWYAESVDNRQDNTVIILAPVQSDGVYG